MTTAPQQSVVVVGAGPGGLAAAAALASRGVRATVLERGDTVATSWRGHYDRLHLHTTRRLSKLPGLPIPRAYGRWVGRDDVVRYLERYTAHHGLAVRTHTTVERIDRRRGEPWGSRWTLVTGDGEELAARTVIVATGFNHTPYIPDWPGVDSFTGRLVHAAEYRNARPYAGQEVLVVGTGNTGTEIAVDLAESGAPRVLLAVRTPPHIVRRSTAGWPAQATGIMVRRLPPAVVDRAGRVVTRLSVPDLSRYGLPRPQDGLYTRLLRDGAIPVQDVGLIDAVRAGQVEPVASVTGFDADRVLLADGSVARPDAVVAATGYRRALEPLVGHLGVLNERGRPRVSGGSPAVPGLFFTGFTNPISGMFREMAIDARRIARAVHRDRPGD